MSRNSKRHPVDTFCNNIVSQYPGTVDFYTRFRSDRTIIKGECPAWCELPAVSIASALANGDKRFTLEQMYEQDIVYELTASLIWSRNKMIYRFDGTLSDTLTAQRLDSKIPSEIVDYLPYPCVFIERAMTIAGYKVTGFFAWLDWGTKGDVKLLRLLLLKSSGGSFRVAIPLSGGTIAESILEMANLDPRITRKYTEEAVHDSPVAQTVIECVNLLLYLCSEKPDMPDDTELKTRRSRDKHGNPKRAVTWDVGTRIGAALRKAFKSGSESETTPNESSYSSPRPHMRRAHWHSFWTGKRGSSERKLILRWLPPIAVNIDGEELPTVVSSVKSDGNEGG